MVRKLVQTQLIPHKKSFRQELTRIILRLDLPKYPNKKGNKQFTTAQRLSVVILYFRSNKSLRVFCEEFKETKWSQWLELKFEIKKSTLHDWIQSFNLDFIKTILDETNRGENPELLGIDGTGIATQFKSSYYQKRLDDFGQKPKSNYHKLDIIGDMNGTKKIFDFSFLMKQRHDIYVAWKLFKRFRFKNTVMIGDRGYFDYGLFGLMIFKNNYFLFPPKNFGGKCVHNNMIYKKITINYHKHKDVYNKRSNIEGIFSSLKRTVLTKIMSKKCSTKKREMGLKLVIYNMNKNISCALNFLFRILDLNL